MSEKQCPRGRGGLGDLDGRFLVACSTIPPIEDKLSAMSAGNQPRDASTLLHLYDECIQADHIEERVEHLLVVFL